jgi:wyosine [tRNA(Phe)-imidazoG37] synthetase (radical SAM superfamily)
MNIKTTENKGKLATETFVIKTVKDSKIKTERYLGALLEAQDDKIEMLIESFNNKTDILEKKIEESKYEILENLTLQIQSLK